VRRKETTTKSEAVEPNPKATKKAGISQMHEASRLGGTTEQLDSVSPIDMPKNGLRICNDEL
jgi:hypothetical protein